MSSDQSLKKTQHHTKVSSRACLLQQPQRGIRFSLATSHSSLATSSSKHGTRVNHIARFLTISSEDRRSLPGAPR